MLKQNMAQDAFSKGFKFNRQEVVQAYKCGRLWIDQSQVHKVKITSFHQ